LPRSRSSACLVGSARRLGIVAKAREVRGVDRVVIRDGDAIGALLTRIGAHESVLAWEERECVVKCGQQLTVLLILMMQIFVARLELQLQQVLEQQEQSKSW
jgi:hypothetical protein